MSTADVTGRFATRMRKRSDRRRGASAATNATVEEELGLEGELRSGDLDLVGGDPGNPVVVVDLVPHPAL